MKRYLLILATLICMSPLYAQNSELWKQVESFEEQSLPKSALQVIDKIYQNSLKNNDSAELIKSIIYQLKFETSIDRDTYPEKIKEIENFAAQDKNKVEQAMLYSLLANLYLTYSSGFNQKSTALSGYIPEDIREWPANLFIKKISDLVDLSLQPAKELQETPTLKYQQVLTQGESSRTLRPTLYDFIAYEGIKTLSQLNNDYRTQNHFVQTKFSDKSYFAPVNEFIQIRIPQQDYDFTPKIASIYQQLLQFRSLDNNKQALLMADLDRLDFIENNYVGELGEKYYMEAINTLKNEYKSDDFVVEILFREASLYWNMYNGDPKVREENLKKAYEISSKGIKEHPSYERIGLLENLISNITSSNLSTKTINTVYPEKELTIEMNYRNLDQIDIEIYKINAPVTVYTHTWSRNGQYEKTGTLVKKQTVNLINNYPYLSSDTTINIHMEELGNYEFVIKTETKNVEPANQQFSVSRLGTVARTVENKREYLVVDRISGKPIDGAQVNLYKRSSNQSLELYKSLLTDKMGLAQDMGEDDIASYNVISGEDKYLITSFAPWISTYNSSNTNDLNLNIFTDRSIYRPGQTVYFKGIAYENGVSQQKVIPNKTYTLTFRDANNQEITNRQLTTNEFGSLSGEFVIPHGLLTGSFSIVSNTDRGYASIRVEEYKRPTFDIKFNKKEQTYNFGDQVKVTGNIRTFSGVNLQDTDVRYTITRQNHWLYRGFFYSNVQVAQGSTTTNENGNFEISFTTDKAFEDKDNTNVFYTYIIEATVTSTNGETQTTTTSYTIGDKSMFMTITGLSNTLIKEDLPEITINSFNLSGNPITTTGSFEIYELNIIDKNNLTNEDDNWRLGKLVTSGTFEAGKGIDKKKIQSLVSGKYRIIAKAKDLQNREVETQQDFIFASKKDKQPPLPGYLWVWTPKIICEPGEVAEIIVGSSAKNVYVLYEIFNDKKKIKAERFILTNENKKIEIPFLDSYGEGISVTFSFIKDEKFYTQTIQVERKQPDKKLTLKMEVFRDRLLPGEKEEWKISVNDEKENQVLAELLAGMYDASLDKIYPHSWMFNPIRTPSIWTVSSRSGNEFSFSTAYLQDMSERKEVPAFIFDSFNWFGFDPRSSLLFSKNELQVTRIRGTNSGSISIAENTQIQGNIGDMASLQENQVMETILAPLVPEDTATGASDDIQIRENFSETAFFYPQLKTNNAGETILSFTVPESNTTWKLMAIAHTKDLQYGQLVKEAISQKKLMVSPNVPRFIREGDKTNISANISNLSEENISGTAVIEFLDPETNQTNIQVLDASKSFHVESGKTTTVNWTFDVPSGINLSKFKIVAQAATFSDGEQHLIPVLPNRMLVTESMPLNVIGKQTKDYTFDKLAKPSPTLSNYRLTLEITSNPIWYAIQALPSLVAPDSKSDNAVSWFSTYYTNSIAYHLVNSTPKVKEMIDIWTKQGGTHETLVSNLEKNQELKNILLEETPWVMEAKNESEQKQRLALLFDINRINNLEMQAMSKLKELQSRDGGWAWFKGFSSSLSVTQWILYGLGELSQLQGYTYPDAEVIEMKVDAINFIDKAFIRHFEDLKKNNKDWQKQKSISTYELEYLFVRSYHTNIPLMEVEEAITFYEELVAKNWKNTSGLYDRALAAIIMQRKNNTEIAQKIIKSLREHASKKDELGMYWANNNTNAFMTQSATTVHTFIMQAFNEVGTTKEEMDAMKLWLVKQKQTQLWESVPATVSSINILFKTGSNWLDDKGRVTVKLGNQMVNTDQQEAGTGYVKQVYDAASIRPEMGKITVSKSYEGPAWGSLYWQYFENLDKITAAKTGLNIEKSIFKEETTTTGKTLIPVSENSPLKVGDKVTMRLTIRTDRDMEFVQLKDMRAACFEPIDQISGTQWKHGLLYYQAPQDASMNFYFSALPKGTYVLEYSLYTTATGDYSNGITTIQCLYAPEFVSHTSGNRVVVK